MDHPLDALLRVGAISRVQCDAGYWYAEQLQRFRIARAPGEKAMLEAIRAVVWRRDESGHSFRLVVGIAGLGEQWKCVTDLLAGTPHPRGDRQMAMLREGLRRIAEFRSVRKAA